MDRTDLAARLMERFPEKWHAHLNKKGNLITYVSWHHYADQLDRLVGPTGWHTTEPVIDVRDGSGIGAPLHSVDDEAVLVDPRLEGDVDRPDPGGPLLHQLDAFRVPVHEVPGDLDRGRLRRDEDEARDDFLSAGDGPPAGTSRSAARSAAKASPPVAGLSRMVRGRRSQSVARFHQGSRIRAISSITPR